jgi:hypothetical protein
VLGPRAEIVVGHAVLPRAGHWYVRRTN